MMILSLKGWIDACCQHLHFITSKLPDWNERRCKAGATAFIVLELVWYRRVEDAGLHGKSDSIHRPRKGGVLQDRRCRGNSTITAGYLPGRIHHSSGCLRLTMCWTSPHTGAGCARPALAWCCPRSGHSLPAKWSAIDMQEDSG